MGSCCPTKYLNLREISMADDKAELLQSLRIERSDAIPKPVPRRQLLVWLAGGVALVAVVVGFLGLSDFPTSVDRQFGLPGPIHREEAQSSAEPALPAPPPAVTARRPSRGLVASGYVVARRKATVAAEVTAKVVEVLVHEGMMVKKGDVLAQLDSVLPTRDLALARSKADAAAAAIGAVAAELQDAERIMNRNRRLRQVVSEADLTKSEARVGVLRAQLKQSQAVLDTAKQDAKHAAEVLDQYTVHAPFDGVVVERDAQPGEMISPLSVGGFTRTGICTLVDMDSIEVDVDVNEAFVGRLHLGMPVSAVPEAYPDWAIPASVIDILPSADREKGTVKVRIGLEKKDPRILVDMSVKVSFEDTSAAIDTSPQLSLPQIDSE
jgi:HlyD family secretion protein